MKIPFNKPVILTNEIENIKQVIENQKLSGDGVFTKKCHNWFEKYFNCKKAFLTTSCTHALEMAAILSDIKFGDEVIMPSNTFVSTANAFVLRGAKIVFVDVRPDTMNIDENLIESAITKKTKVIVPVHYAGVACDMDKIMSIAVKYNLLVVEDAAQAVMAKYKGRWLGTIGHFGCYSFHETKNYTCGEGGALIVNDKNYIERAEIIREKGTNRSKFFRGQVDKYTWIDIGSSYLPSEFNSAYLFAQLESAEKINNKRLCIWNMYYECLKRLQKEKYLELPFVPSDCEHNAHMFFIKVKDIIERQNLINYLDENGVNAVFHYVPLHNSPYGLQHGIFYGSDRYTTRNCERLLRLPMFFDLTIEEVQGICKLITGFYDVNL